MSVVRLSEKAYSDKTIYGLSVVDTDPKLLTLPA